MSKDQPIVSRARVEARLKELGLLSMRDLSLTISNNDDFVRQTVTSANPTYKSLALLARALDRPLAWLTAETEAEAEALLERDRQLAPVSPTPLRDLPVRGTASGAVLDGGFAGTSLEEAPADFVYRPAPLANVAQSYAVYVRGDSMAPEHGDGALRVVHPGRVVRKGDTVVVRTQHWEGGPAQSYIKHFVRSAPAGIVLAQLHPPLEITIPHKYVVSTHRVLTTNELLGV